MVVKLDLSELLVLLRTEGRRELQSACAGGGGKAANLLRQWDDLLSALSKLIGNLKRGASAEILCAEAKGLLSKAKPLSTGAMEVLSFIPGPVGIVCSVFLAIVAICDPNVSFPQNVANGFLVLLGALPGFKFVGKGATKLAPKIKTILQNLLKRNPSLRKSLMTDAKVSNDVKKFAANEGSGSGSSIFTQSSKQSTGMSGKGGESIFDKDITQRTVNSRTITDRSIQSPSSLKSPLFNVWWR